MNNRLLATVVAMSAVTFSNTVDVQSAGLRTIALTGISEEPFNRFEGAPAIDDHGRVTFIAQSGSTPDVTGVWIDSQDGRRLIAAAGDTAPHANASFDQFSDLVLSDDGTVVFKATLSGPQTNSSNRESIWLSRGESLELVARTDDQAPGGNEERRFAAFEGPAAVGESGHVSFYARTRHADSPLVLSSGLWLYQAAGSALAAHADSPAAVEEPGVVFSPQGFEAPFSEDPVVSPLGQTIFRGFLSGPGINEANLNGLWSARGGEGLELLLRAGQPAPLSGGGNFQSFPSVPTINAAGDTAFVAFFDDLRPAHHGSGGDPHMHGEQDHEHAGHRNLGLWLRRASGQVTRLFAIGDDAPAIAEHAELVDTFNPVMNAAGNVAVVAVVDGEGIDTTNEMGLWSNALSDGDQLELVARQGDRPPGTPEGFVFNVLLSPSLNSEGQSAWMATTYRQTPGEPVETLVGIWGQDRNGVLRLVARQGQRVEVADGDVREIASLSLASGTGGQDGKRRGLSDQGEVAFWASFSDGSSGIFLSNVLAVPEPGSDWLAVLAAIMIVCSTARQPALRAGKESLLQL